ncbi:hypothetical protein H8784_11980 [Parabacteroides acidifaciens]|uniref:Uncharacterized protein n=1 Tax=Parabacteroides acidifaciens TaxID=2290935 RepID=A0ABR7P3L3_9BACT|nr:hypothetical protein [Parabacteroides acidifaciens]MBC8602427.1 hypothetical protein [Parabacteroides acidifaciens]
MRKSVVYLFVSVFFLFTSCEYQLGENFVEMENHQVDSVTTSVDFYGFIHDLENEIYVVKHSGNVVCEIYPLPGFEVEKQIIRLGELEWESDGIRCDFVLDVDRIPNGSYELSCEIFARTNSGTVAGQVGTEHYVEKRSWPLKVDARNGSDKLLPYEINEEGHPVIFWEVDESERNGFDYYTIEYSIENYTYIRRSYDFDQRSFVDEKYTGGGGTYEVYIYFKDETHRPYSLGKAVLVANMSNLENTPEK